ncbi:MAG: glycosyltransferase family 4 protein [Clostridia bacterium]|nr:glycosyltransferase family 4 protein [Clostridia bacterium]
MIKVVEVSSDSNIGGAGKCILTFLKNFDREKFEVCVVLPRGSLLKPEVENCKVKVFELDNLAEKSLDLKAVSELRRLFKRLKPDVVHTHASMSARLAAKQCKIKTVYTRHSVFPPPASISKGLGKLVNGFVNNHTADKIIAVAEAAKDNLTATGVCTDKIEVILNGVDALKPYDAQRLAGIRKKYAAADEKLALMAARLNVVKGHKYFIEAAKLLRDRGHKFKFLIAGTGDTEAELKSQIAAEGLEEYVTMLGFVEDVEPLMNIMDVQVNCSFGTEATSLALLEGMSLGKPAVVTDFGGNPGVISDGENGFLIPTHDAEELADKLELLLGDEKLYDEMSEKSKKIYNEKFTSEVNTRAIEKVYAELAGDKTGRND